jgi:hypothetical protein
MTTFGNQSKSLLARLLATENISVQYNSNLSTASFDVKNRILYLPVWENVSEDLHDMLIIHEVGHALDTPEDEWLNALIKIAISVYGKDDKKYLSAARGFLNVIEDARIDKRQKRRYPGSKINYVKGYKELIDRNFFKTKDRDINTYPFIDRLNIYFKGGAALNIQFTKDEKVYLKKASELETFDDAVALSEELFRLSKEAGETNRIENSDDHSFYFDEDGEEVSVFDYEDSDAEDVEETETDGEGSESSENSDSDAEDIETAGEETEDSDGDTDTDTDADGDEKDVDDASESESSNGPEGNSSEEEFVPKSETDDAWEEEKANISSNSKYEYRYLKLPTPIYENIIVDYKKVLHDMVASFNSNPLAYNVFSKELTEFMKKESDTISFMVKEFEMKKSADIYSRVSIAKTGVIDTNKLHSYRYNDDIFRRLSIVPQGKNHGFVMFVDWSGSMTTNMLYTVKQLISLTMFCKRVQIPFEVYSFREICGKDESKPSWNITDTNNTIRMDDFRLRNILSSRMNINELRKAYTYIWSSVRLCLNEDQFKGTPLNGALLVADKIVNDFRKKNKIQIVSTIFLTDGESNPSRFPGVDNGYNYVTKKTVVAVISDEKTKKQYQLTDRYTSFTITLQNILKERTGCNLLGFYLYGGYSSKFNRVYQQFFGSIKNGEHYSKTQTFWKENNFITVTSHGYDNYYIINPDKKILDLQLVITDKMTKNKMAKEFTKYSEKKSINRVLLKQFVDKIASEKQIA